MSEKLFDCVIYAVLFYPIVPLIAAVVSSFKSKHIWCFSVYPYAVWVILWMLFVYCDGTGYPPSIYAVIGLIVSLTIILGLPLFIQLKSLTKKTRLLLMWGSTFVIPIIVALMSVGITFDSRPLNKNEIEKFTLLELPDYEIVGFKQGKKLMYRHQDCLLKFDYYADLAELEEQLEKKCAEPPFESYEVSWEWKKEGTWYVFSHSGLFQLSIDLRSKVMVYSFIDIWGKRLASACVADNGAEDATTEVSESHENELRKIWEESKLVDSVSIATDRWYPMPITDFPEKVTQEQLDNWKKILLEIRHKDGFVIPTQFLGGDEDAQLWQADLTNYLHYIAQTGDSADYKLIRYYANAIFSYGSDDIENETDRAFRLLFNLDRAAGMLGLASNNVRTISNLYAYSYRNSYIMYQHILQKCNFIDFYVSIYSDSIKGNAELQKEFNALKNHLNDIKKFELSGNYKPSADLRNALCYHVNAYDYYENTLKELAYVDYILPDEGFNDIKLYDRISTEEINDAIDQLKKDLILNADTVYTEITLKDDLRFIEVYRSSLNKWLKSREKALAKLSGKEYDAFLKADNAVRYFCMMHIKNAFRHYNEHLDDEMREYKESLYTFNSPEDSVRYGRNWFQKSIDLEKY